MYALANTQLDTYLDRIVDSIQQLRQLDAQAQQHVNTAALAQGIEAFCRRVLPTLDTLTFAQRRQLVVLLIDRVIVNDAQVEIRYVVPTGPQGETTPFCHLRLDYFTTKTASIFIRCCFRIIGVVTDEMPNTPIAFDISSSALRYP